MKKYTKSLLFVSLAVMESPSTPKIDIPIDLSLEDHEDSGDSDSTNFADSIPSMDGVPPKPFC